VRSSLLPLPPSQDSFSPLFFRTALFGGIGGSSSFSSGFPPVGQLVLGCTRTFFPFLLAVSFPRQQVFFPENGPLTLAELFDTSLVADPLFGQGSFSSQIRLYSPFFFCIPEHCPIVEGSAASRASLQTEGLMKRRKSISFPTTDLIPLFSLVGFFPFQSDRNRLFSFPSPSPLILHFQFPRRRPSLLSISQLM